MVLPLLLFFTPLVSTIVGGFLGGEGGPLVPPQPCSLSSSTFCPYGEGKQEFGYIEVSPANKYFYAAMEADEPDPSAPPRTFIYMAGGPGRSSLNPLTTINGPCRTTPDGNSIIPNEYSWTQQNHGIWVDAPGPIGFSEGPVEADLEEFIGDMVTFVDGVLKKHPNLNEDVHLVGYSSSALIVAMVAERIVKSPGSSVDLKGVMMYSGFVGPYDMYYGCYQMAKDRKLLPQAELDKMFTGLQKCKEEISKCNGNGPGGEPVPAQCKAAVDTCEPVVQKPLEDANLSLYDVRTSPREESKYDVFMSGNALALLNSPCVQQELGATKKWEELNTGVFDAFSEYKAYDGTYYVARLLDNCLKVLVVTGDEDYLANAEGTTEWLFKLKGVENYGKMLGTITPVDLKYDRGGLLGKIRALTYLSGGKLAFIEVTGGSDRLIRNRPAGMQQAVLDFTRGRLW